MIIRVLWPSAVMFIIVFVETRNIFKAVLASALIATAAATYIYFWP